MQLLRTPPLLLSDVQFRGSPVRSFPRFTLHTQTKSYRTCPHAFFNPIVKEALKEPVAFLGGVFAGLFRLDLTDDPLKEWVARTSEAAGLENMMEPEVEEETPQEIQIE